MDAGDIKPATPGSAPTAIEASRRGNLVNTTLAAWLGRVHKRLKPWHVYVWVAASVVAIVLATVLVHVRDQQRNAVSNQNQSDVSYSYILGPSWNETCTTPD
jgi:hypothetical protein